MPDRMPAYMPEHMSDRMPDRMSEYMSDKSSEYIKNIRPNIHLEMSWRGSLEVKYFLTFLDVVC